MKRTKFNFKITSIQKRSKTYQGKMEPWMIKVAKKMCAYLGTTNIHLAKVFEVDVSTIENWIRKNEEFRNAIQIGRFEIGTRVAQSLVQKALGCTVPHIITASYKGEIFTRKVKKYLPPDPYAAKQYLSIMFRDIWSDKVFIDMNTTLNYRKIEDIPIKELSKKEQEAIFGITMKQLKVPCQN